MNFIIVATTLRPGCLDPSCVWCSDQLSMATICKGQLEKGQVAVAARA